MAKNQLGIILESKVVQKLNLEKNGFTKKWFPQLIFLNEMTLKIDFESTILALFDEP